MCGLTGGRSAPGSRKARQIAGESDTLYGRGRTIDAVSSSDVAQASCFCCSLGLSTCCHPTPWVFYGHSDTRLNETDAGNRAMIDITFCASADHVALASGGMPRALAIVLAFTGQRVSRTQGETAMSVQISTINPHVCEDLKIISRTLRCAFRTLLDLLSPAK